MRCAKFCVAVLQASILNWGVSLPWVFVHCAIYETYVVSWFCRDLSSIGGGSICHRYMCIVLYIYRSAMRCSNFGVAVFKASMVNCRGAICHGYMCLVLYIYIYIYIYIYRSAMRCAKVGVVVLQASMLDWRVSISHGYMCIVLYMKLIWCNGFAEIYARLERGQSAIGICALFYIYVTVQGCTGTLDGLVGSHTRLAIYPTLTICCQRVVIHALLDTGFKGMQVVTCPANVKQLKSY